MVVVIHSSRQPWGTAIVFTVIYSEGPEVTIAEGGFRAAVTVTYSIDYPKLPDTGVADTTLYTIGGLLLITGVAILLMYKYIPCGKEDFVSSHTRKSIHAVSKMKERMKSKQ